MPYFRVDNTRQVTLTLCLEDKDEAALRFRS